MTMIHERFNWGSDVFNRGYLSRLMGVDQERPSTPGGATVQMFSATLEQVCGSYAVEWMGSAANDRTSTRYLSGMRVNLVGRSSDVRATTLQHMERAHVLLPRYMVNPVVGNRLSRCLMDSDYRGKAHLWTYMLAHSLGETEISPTRSTTQLLSETVPLNSCRTRRQIAAEGPLLVGPFMNIVNEPPPGLLQNITDEVHRILTAEVDVPAFLWSFLVCPVETMDEWFGPEACRIFLGANGLQKSRLLEAARTCYLRWLRAGGRPTQFDNARPLRTTDFVINTNMDYQFTDSELQERVVRATREIREMLNNGMGVRSGRVQARDPLPTAQTPKAPEPPPPREIVEARRTVFGKKVQVVTQGASVTIEPVCVGAESKEKEQAECTQQESGSASRPAKSRRMAFRRFLTPPLS